MMVDAIGADGDIHIYDVDLTTSSLPTAVQVGTFSAASTSVICDYTSAMTNTSMPTTLFVLLHVTSSTCGSSGDTVEVVRYADGAASPAIVSALGTGQMVTLYKTNGVLAGIVAVDRSNNLDLFSDSTFSSPTVLLSGLPSGLMTESMALNQGVGSTGGFAFLNVPVAGIDTLYRIDATGSFVKIYTATGTLGPNGVVTGTGAWSDDNSVFFTDTSGGSISIYQAPLAGGKLTLLYSFAPPTGTTFEFVGSNDSTLVYSLTTPSTTPGLIASQTQLLTLKEGSAGTPTVLGTYSGEASAGLTPLPPAGTLASAAVFVNVAGPGNSSPLGPFTYSSAALTPAGASLQALTANSQWSGLYGPSGSFVDTIKLQFNHITDTGPGQNGGATVDEVNLASLGSTPTALGGTFTVPSGCELALTAGYTNAIVSGGLFCENIMAGTFALSGAAANLSLDQLVAPISITNSEVGPGISRRAAKPGPGTR